MRILGRNVNTLAGEDVLDDHGRVDAGKLHVFAFDQMKNGYYTADQQIGQAWHDGAELMKK